LAVALGSCGTLSVSPADKKSDRAAVDASVVQSLQRQIRDREKRIAELETQLDALKLIDQDIEKRRQSTRPPATLTPIE
jgi:TolA-binding protein